MAKKILDDDGVTEIEVYTAAEVQERETAAAKKKEDEFNPIKAELEGKLTDAERRAAVRAGEFKQFRTLSEDQAAKLTVAERTIYENGLALEDERKKRAETEKTVYQAQVDAALKAKSGGDDKIFQKMKEVWAIIGIEAITPDQIEKKANMVIGSIRQSEPDLVAQAFGTTSGGALPPKQAGSEDKSFADTPKGQAFAKELGLTLEAPKK